MPSRADVSRVDREGMYDAVASLPEQIREGMAIGEKAFLPSRAPSPYGCTHLLVCGMGASGIVGDIAASWFGTRLGVRTVRDYDSPETLAPHTLAVAVSFSGETEETLSAFTAALDRGQRGVAVTAGGRLQALAVERGLPVALIPRKVQARAALGLLLGPFGPLVGPPMQEELAAALGELEHQRAPLLAGIETPRNKAKALAAAMEGQPVAFVADAALLPVARRWAAQLHENAKVLAWASEMPEADHNEIVAWAEDPAPFLPVFLRHAEEGPEMRRRLDLTADIVAARRPVANVELGGNSRIARILGGIQLADFTSVYLAVRRGVDPTPQRAIDELKRRLRE
jgi:glucose/mannose-6-phosphate isomerase